MERDYFFQIVDAGTDLMGRLQSHWSHDRAVSKKAIMNKHNSKSRMYANRVRKVYTTRDLVAAFGIKEAASIIRRTMNL